MNSGSAQWSWKKIGAAAISGMLSVAMLAGCGSGSSGTSSNAVKITIFNSKPEIQSQMVSMAKKYSQEKGVDVQVYSTVDFTTKYASKDPYTISMADPKDIYQMANDGHATDLSDQSWVKDTTHAISVNGKVYGFPVAVEARGLIYNGAAIEKITGKKFNPTKYETLTSFKKLLAELKKGGMASPTGVLKEDWSLGAHYLAQVYEEQKDPGAFVKELNAGKVNLMDNEKFNLLMNTFDVLKDNNYAASSAISAEREVTEQNLAEGKIAFMFGGNWDWTVLNQYDYSNDMGIMPVPQNTSDGSNTKLVGGASKYFFIDSSKYTSGAQRKAAKAFLTWLVFDKEGQTFIAKDCSLVSPFGNNRIAVADPLGKSVKKYEDSDKIIASYDHLPNDHYSVLGADFQKYLAGQESRSAFATEIETYWKTAKLS